MSSTLSRGQFLTTGLRGGLVLAAGGTVLAMSTNRALGADTGDIAIAKLAATAELLAIDFYGRAIKGGRFSGDELAYLTAAQKNEQDHYDALAGVLGADAPKGIAFMYPAGTFASAKSIAATGVALETAFVGAYIGAVEALVSNELKATAGLVAANEA
jgi:Ferritin-like domain